MNDYALSVNIRCSGQGSPPGNKPFPTVRKSQLYDRDDGQIQPQYLPVIPVIKRPPSVPATKARELNPYFSKHNLNTKRFNFITA